MESNAWPEIGKSYDSQMGKTLGEKREYNGNIYVYGKVASGTRISKYNAVTLTSAGVATKTSTKRVNAIAMCDFLAYSENLYGWFMLIPALGEYIQYYTAATASATATAAGTTSDAVSSSVGAGVPLIYTASLDGAIVDGTVADSSATAASAAAADINTLKTGMMNMAASMYEAVGDQILVLRRTTSRTFNIWSATTGVSAQTSGVREDLEVGDYIAIVSGDYAEFNYVSAVATATTGTSAALKAAFTTDAIGSGATSTAAPWTGTLLVYAKCVKSIFK